MAAVLTLATGTANAQVVNGTAEWAIAQNTGASDTQTTANHAIWQNYTFGYSAPLLDRRLASYNGELLFRTSTLAVSGSQQAEQHGSQSDLGFKVAASLLPESPFPFYVQALRVNNGSSGDFSPTSIRSGIAVPSGTAPPDVNALNTLVNLGGQLNLGNWPRLQASYRKGGSVVTGGSYYSEQSSEDVSAAVTKDTSRIRQSFRYQKTSFDNFVFERFAQRLDNLDYDLEALIGKHVRLLAHGGRRLTFSESTLSVVPADPNGAPYQPPASSGTSGSEYATGGLSYEPTPRFFVRLTASLDWQRAGDITTSARLATVISHYEVLRGLSVNVTGVSGNRQQILGGVPTRVTTESGTGGLTYQGGPRWLSGTLGLSRGMGSNATPDGTTGQSRSWSGDGGLSSTIGWLGLGAGYERADFRDEILDLGNYRTERVRGSVQAQSRRVTLSTNADRARISRGQADTLTENLQRTLSVSAVYRAWHDGSITATAGQFTNEYTSTTGAGRDGSLFWNLGTQVPVADTLRISAWVRSENVDASKTLFTQRGLSSYGRVEYRFRATSIALEYRANHSRVVYATAAPDAFSGRQIRVSVMRQFGFRV